MPVSQGFSWHELPLKEIGQFSTFRQLSQRFRQQNAVGLITRLEALQGYVSLNLLAPRNAAFWGVRTDSIVMSMDFHLEKTGLARAADGKKLFLRDLRKASVKLSDPAIHMFSSYERYFPSRTRTLPGFSEDGVTVDYFRFVSLACSEDALPHLISHLDLQVEQLGNMAFFAIDDCINLDPGHYIDKTPFQYLFRRWVLTDPCAERRKAWWEELKTELEYQLSRVVAGDHLNVPLSPAHFIRPGLSFYLADAAVGGYDEIEDPACRSIISLRARLIRELGWPVFYDEVCLMLASEYIGEPRRVDFYGILEPYDVVSELEEYKREMEQRYPCLLENPL